MPPTLKKIALLLLVGAIVTALILLGLGLVVVLTVIACGYVLYRKARRLWQASNNRTVAAQPAGQSATEESPPTRHGTIIIEADYEIMEDKEK